MRVVDLLVQVKEALSDAGAKYWTNKELVDYLQSGRVALYTMKPRIYERTEVLSLSAGFRHTLPHNADVFFALIDNVTSQSKRAITVVNRELLGRVRPRWRSEAQSDEIAHYMYAESEPTQFETYPAAKAGTQVRINYAVSPTNPQIFPPLTDANDIRELAHEREHAEALIDYVMHRAFLKEVESSPEMASLAEARFQSFISKVIGEVSSKTKASPNTTQLGGRPPTVPA